MAGAVELAGPALLCIENLKGHGQVGWTPTGLCQTQTLKYSWEAWNDVWAGVPTGVLWCMAYMDGLTCPKLNRLLYLGMALFACLSLENSGNPANQLGSV